SRTAKDALLWLRHPLTGRLGDGTDSTGEIVLERYDLKKRAKSELGKDFRAFEVSGDGTRLVVNGKNGLQTRPAAEGDEVVTIELDRVSVQLDPVAEWRQGYREAGRLMRDHFWRADMNGVDWQGVLDRYAPLVERIGAYSELVDLLWEVQGELGTSHAYAIGNGQPVDPRRRQGLLGADLARDEDGTWRVTRILPGESSDHDARSPLLAPGVAVRPGDALVAVNGRPVDPVRGPLPLLAGTANQPIQLTVRPATGGETRTVVVTPISDETRLRYHDWVENRRAYVREASGGRLGYLHVPDMVASGWAQFHRDLRTEMAYEGLVVDVRENGGGHVSELILEKLSRKVTGWIQARGHEPMRYPEDSPRGPVVTVTDEFAGSDGDIVSAGIKNRDIGPLVGVRTWGGVIGIDQRYSLVDGTVVTQPRYSFWLAGHGWGVEDHGRDPARPAARPVTRLVSCSHGGRRPRQKTRGSAHTAMPSAQSEALDRRMIRVAPSSGTSSVADRPGTAAATPSSSDLSPHSSSLASANTVSVTGLSLRPPVTPTVAWKRPRPSPIAYTVLDVPTPRPMLKPRLWLYQRPLIRCLPLIGAVPLGVRAARKTGSPANFDHSRTPASLRRISSRTGSVVAKLSRTNVSPPGPNDAPSLRSTFASCSSRSAMPGRP